MVLPPTPTDSIHTVVIVPKLTEEESNRARKRWRWVISIIRSGIKIRKALAWQDGPDGIQFRCIRDEKDLEDALAFIKKYRRYKSRQDFYHLLVNFAGKDISRKADKCRVDYIVISTLHGHTYIIDMISPAYWAAILPILEDPMIEKVVFDGRHFADYMKYTHKKELRGMYDLKVMEALERGNLKYYKELPYRRTYNKDIRKWENKLDTTLFFTKKEMMSFYLAPPFICDKQMPYAEWRKRVGDTRSPTKECIDWLLDHQRMMLQMFDKFDWLKAYEKKKYLNWWVSSETYCSLLSLRPVRNFDSVIEKTEMIPKRVLARHSTDYPIGLIKCIMCYRFGPSADFTEEMIRRETYPVCVSCVRVLHNVYYRSSDGLSVLVKDNYDGEQELQITKLQARQVQKEIAVAAAGSKGIADKKDRAVWRSALGMISAALAADDGDEEKE